MTDGVSRRSFLKTTGPAGLMVGLPEAAMGFQANQSTQQVTVTVAPPEKPKYSIRFSVIGIDHNHIRGITDALKRGGGQLVSVYSTNLPALADYNVTAADVKALDDLRTDFSNVKTAVPVAKSNRAAQTKTLPQAIKDNQTLLRKQLDKQMTKFKTTNPEFYAGYQAARTIVNRRSHHTGTSPAPAPTPAPTATTTK